MVRSLCLLLIVAVPAAAQEPQIPVRKLTITPAAAPVPALHYKLLPELRDTTPGNAALLYYRAFSPEWWSFYQKDPEMTEKLDAARKMPLAELRTKSKPGGEFGWVRDSMMLKEVDRAARRSHCDWELTERAREEGISLLLPDVQSMRYFALMLAVRSRIELADGQYDQAARTFQTGMQMGRHVAEAPTLIQALVGVAAAAMTLNQVEEWIRTPGSPNLYWALSTLPQPYVDLRGPFQGERMLLDNLMPGFREALIAGHMRPMPLDQLRESISKVSGLADGPLTGVPLGVVAIVAKKYGPAKGLLKARGWDAAEVDALPAMQVVLLYEVATYDRLFDDMVKWWSQPYSVAQAGLEQAERRLKEEVVRSGAPGLSMAGILLPAINRVHFASVRTDRTINLLRTVEALRLHAAAHGGLPEKLAEVTEAPMPLDPVTGQPFEYRRDGATAVLTAPPPAGERPNEGNSRRYEITLVK